MAIQNGNAQAADLGLRALALFLRLHGVNAEPDQLRDRCGRQRDRRPRDASLRARVRGRGPFAHDALEAPCGHPAARNRIAA